MSSYLKYFVLLITFFVMTPSAYSAEETIISETSDTIGPDGGTITLKDYASLTLPKGWTTGEAKKVRLYAVNSDQDKKIFESSKAIYSAVSSGDEIVVDVGKELPKKPLRLSFPVPEYMMSALPKDHTYVVYLGEESGGSEESLFSFEPETSTVFSAADKNASVDISLKFYTSSFSKESNYQARAFLGTIKK